MMAYITDGRIVKNFSLAEMTNKQAKDEIKLVLTPEVVEHAQMMQELRGWAVKTYPNIFCHKRTAGIKLVPHASV